MTPHGLARGCRLQVGCASLHRVVCRNRLVLHRLGVLSLLYFPWVMGFCGPFQTSLERDKDSGP